MTKRWTWIAATAGMVALAGCGGGGNRNSQAGNNIDAMKAAADQSSPAAREVLRNEARNLSGQETSLPPSDPNSPAQQALNKAGNVEAAQQTGTAPANSAQGNASGRR